MRAAEATRPTRTFIRLKHNLVADEEIDVILPDTFKEFEEKLARGELIVRREEQVIVPIDRA